MRSTKGFARPSLINHYPLIVSAFGNGTHIEAARRLESRTVLRQYLRQAIPGQIEVSCSHAGWIWHCSIGSDRHLHGRHFFGRIAFHVAVGIACTQLDLDFVKTLIPGDRPVGAQQPCLLYDRGGFESLAASVRVATPPVVIAEIIAHQQLALTPPVRQAARPFERIISFCKKADIIPVETVSPGNRVRRERCIRIVPVVPGVPGFLKVPVFAWSTRAKHHIGIADVIAQVLAHRPVHTRTSRAVARHLHRIGPVPAIPEPDRCNRLGVSLVVVHRKKCNTAHNLLLVARTHNRTHLSPHSAQRRYKYGTQKPNNPNHYK